MANLEIHLSAKEFLHLKTLIDAFDTADDDDAQSIEITVKGLGTISWAKLKPVLISLDKERVPGATS